MRHKSRSKVIALVAVGIGLSGAGTGLARAADVGADAQMTQELQVARSFWRDRNVIGCPGGITAYAVHGLPDDVYGQSGIGWCQVQLNGEWLGRFRVWGSRGLSGAYYRALECYVVTHEVGHALGLEHTRTGLMSTDFSDANVPWDCKVWARSTEARIASKRSTASIRRT